MSEDTAKGFQAPKGSFVDEQTGMPPYWKPSEEEMDQGIAQGFYGRVIGRDDGDPEFPRYVIQAGQDTPCFQGGGDDAEPVLVKKGEFFTCSVYQSLRLERYIGIPVVVQALRKRAIKTAAGRRTIWDWSLRVPDAAQRILNERRQRAAEAMISQGSTMRERNMPAMNGGMPALPPAKPQVDDEIPF